MGDKNTLTITRDDETTMQVFIEPLELYVHTPGYRSGVYTLTRQDGHGVGEIAFNIIDMYEWEYTGEELSQAEAEQVATYVQENMAPMESFFFQEAVDGVEVNYRITANEGHFGIEKDGVFVAEVQHNEVWEQTSGVPLTKETLQRIYDIIEDHYE